MQPVNLPPVPEDSDPADYLTKTIKGCMGTIWVFLGSQVAVSVVLGTIFGIVFGALAAWFSDLAGLDTAYDVSTNFVVLASAAASGILGYAYGKRKLRIRNTRSFSSLNFDKKLFFFGPCMMYALYMPLMILVNILSYLLSLIGLYMPASGLSDASSFWGELFYILSALASAPLFEELVFRGIVLNGCKKYSTSFALFFSALLFGLMHMNLYQAIPVFGMAIAFGLVYLKTNSLVLPVFMHFINNLLAVISSSFIQMETLFVLVFSVAAIIGWIYLLRHRNEYLPYVQSTPQSRKAWKIVFQRPSFWLFVLVFLAMSFSIILF